MMSAEFCAAVFKVLGFDVVPEPSHLRTDLITAITLGSEENMCSFAEAVQELVLRLIRMPFLSRGPCPDIRIRSIMAAGTFVQGSTIEMSADGPVRPPYIMYFQGGFVFEHTMLAVMGAAEKILAARGGLKINKIQICNKGL